MTKIKQFKLTNDEEIICEVLETETDDNRAILIRGALRVIESQDFERGIRFFGFRPWMSFNDDPKILQTINSGHIIGEITPEDKLIKIYMDTINESRYEDTNKVFERPHYLDVDYTVKTWIAIKKLRKCLVGSNPGIKGIQSFLKEQFPKLVK